MFWYVYMSGFLSLMSLFAAPIGPKIIKYLRGLSWIRLLWKQDSDGSHLRKRFCLVGKAFCEFFKAIQDEAIISISLVWAVTKDTMPLETTLPVTFHCLILCSNLGNCLNHRELIPVMPLPPPSPELYRAHASYHWPWFTLNTSQAQRFSGPQAPIGICLPPLWASLLSAHTFSLPDCGSPFFFLLFLTRFTVVVFSSYTWHLWHI